jgi:peptidoglycan/LPS O-acetylase OafA/YrhL
MVKQSRIPTLDGWRSVAVLLVIGAHSSAMLNNSETYFGRLVAKIFDHAGYGVDIFFALSGYLICTLLLEEKKLAGSISLTAFYTRRFFRIVPPILVYLSIVGLLGAILGFSFAKNEVVSVIFFFRNYNVGTWYTSHFWSLAVEEHFYLFVPFLFATLSWRASLWTAISLAIGSIAIRWAELHSAVGGAIEFRTESRLDALMWGAILALLLQRSRKRKWITENLTLPHLSIMSVAAIFVLAEYPTMPLRRTVVALVLPCLIGYTVLNPKTFLGQLLDLPPVVWIGKLSYSLYIWQMLFLTPYARQIPFFQDFPYAFLAILACSMLSYYSIEKPFVRLGHNLAGELAVQTAESRL